MAKGKMHWGWWVLIAVVVILVLWVVGSYNSFITLEQGINGAWSNVENQYQRQADLIPNLVSTVASAVKVETKFVVDVTEARTKWLNAKSENEKDTAGVAMNNGIAALVNAIATSENYPVLQANKNYIALQDELTGTQNRIAEQRRNYINMIQAYNTATLRFPGNVIAGMFGFTQKEYYTAELSSMETPVLGTGTLP